jgi:hypothetical protein
MKMMGAPIALLGYGLDLFSTYMGLTFFRLIELHPFVLTPLGMLVGFAPTVMFLAVDLLARRMGWGMKTVIIFSFLTWVPFLWNIHLWF